MDKAKQQRTPQQNSANHLWFAMISDALNEAGISVQVAIRDSMSVHFTPVIVKEILWRAIQKVQYGKSSTTELNTLENTKVAEELNRYLGEKWGLHVPFPSLDELANQQLQ